ncbi:DUF4249 domain-containing protein [Spirosoma panaciterrae]|uniref:DUF4249 domain-containing protein n=1 Tax=Spirosoma panaciterrae TaxID=496058 RepID=UPI00037D62A3|nr:DUF4249 domain-containing protein [Spirosoma panaciterrae]
MRAFLVFLLAVGLVACVDPEDIGLNGTNDILVVDGTITNLAEPQIVRLNRSRADRLTGRFGTVPVTKATVEVVVDSAQVVAAHETVDGSYQLPSDFKGQIGHAYQLRFSLSDGSRYVSSQQIMQSVPSISQVSATFNLNSLSQTTAIDGFFRAGHDLFIDFQDPVDQRNYYRWDWNLYEKQGWCRSCVQGVYAVNNILPHVYIPYRYYVSGTDPYEDCFVPVQTHDVGQPIVVDKPPYVYDYVCRTQCWEILHNYDINVFDDQYSNGGLSLGRKVAQIPFYTHEPCLVELRQASLSASAYRFYKLLQDQSQKSGGLADTPPTALSGNVKKIGSVTETVVGYFTASAVSSFRYWLDRKDVVGLPLGATDPNGPSGLPGAELFYALQLRQPIPEPTFPPPNVPIWGGPPRPPTAICVSSDTRTPYKPEGWRD